VLKINTIKDLDTAKQVATLLQKENERLHKRIEKLITQMAKLEGKDSSEQLAFELKILKEQMDSMQRRMFGSSSEKRPGDKSADKKDEEKNKQKGHGPTEQANLPIEETFFNLPKDNQVCDLCGGDLAEWKDQFEESEEVTVVERTFKLRKIKRRKYRCTCGACIKTAAGPDKLIKGGRYSLEFAVEVATQKYLDHLPLERQVRIMKREGLKTNSQTLWDQIWALSRHLKPIYDSLPKYIQKSSFIHFDETRWYMLEKGGRKTWQIWSQSNPFAVHYTLHPERSTTAGAIALGDYCGTIVCDGYSVYKALARGAPEKIALAFCWAHVRRKFDEAEANHPECTEVIDLIKELYKIEDQNPDPWKLEEKEREAVLKHRATWRDKESKPLVEEIVKCVGKFRGLKGESHIKAATYFFNHLEGLKLFLNDPNLPIDNNHAERSVRGPVVGRKNHYGSKSKRGTEVAAIFYSLIETAKLHSTNPKEYLLTAARAAIKTPGTIILPQELTNK